MNLKNQDTPVTLPSRRRFLKSVILSALGVTAAAAGGTAYAFDWEPNSVDVNTLTLSLPNLSPAFNGFKLAHISDIHIDPWMTGKRLSRLLRPLQHLQPQALAITGDFLTGSPETGLPQLIEAFRPITQSIPTYAVLGNHDHWAGVDGVRQALYEAGINELENRSATLFWGNDRLHIAGVDDIWEGRQRLDQVLDNIPDNDSAILLAHEPDFAPVSAASGRFMLQLSGHSHGGQVKIPFLGAIITPPLGTLYPAGLSLVQKMYQYTNRGLGMVSPRVRFNCRPEITVLTLQSA